MKNKNFYFEKLYVKAIDLTEEKIPIEECGPHYFYRLHTDDNKYTHYMCLNCNEIALRAPFQELFNLQKKEE